MESASLPRAGIVAYESLPDDAGEDERPGRLDYLPRYDLANFEAALVRAMRNLVLLGVALAETDMARAQCDTIRVRLLKIGARIRVTFRKVWVSLAESYPVAQPVRAGAGEPPPAADPANAGLTTVIKMSLVTRFQRPPGPLQPQPLPEKSHRRSRISIKRPPIRPPHHAKRKGATFNQRGEKCGLARSG